MRIVFMGSAELACPALEALLDAGADEVAAVVTQPPRPRGRRLQAEPCPVMKQAVARGLRVLDPESARDPAFVGALRALAPDAIVLVAYGQFLNREVLDTPSRGCLNLHPSLLPRYRGAAPIAWAVARGETVTGVTVMFMNDRMDAGDIVLQEESVVDPEDTAITLGARLARQGAGLLVRALDLVRRDAAPRRPQDEARVTWAPRLTKEDGRVDWRRSAAEIRNRVRGFQPWPGSYCVLPLPGAPTLRILRVRIEPGAGHPGTLLSVEGDGPLVAAGADAVRLIEVQPAGRKVMPGSAFLRGHAWQPGDRWGEEP